MTEIEKYYVIHTYEAQYPDEVTLYVNDQVTVLEKDERYNDGWWLGRNSAGKIGIFPANYVTKITENKKILNTKTIQHNTIKSLSQPTLSSNAIREWTPEQVSVWLLKVGFDEDIAYNFKDQEISGDVLLELTLDSLKELDVSTFGKRFKLLAAINVLREEARRRKSHKNALTRTNRETINSKSKVYPNEKRAFDDNSTTSRVSKHAIKPITRSYTSADIARINEQKPLTLTKKQEQQQDHKRKQTEQQMLLINKQQQQQEQKKPLAFIPELDKQKNPSPKPSIRIDDFRNIKPQSDSGASHRDEKLPVRSLVNASAVTVLNEERMSQLYSSLMEEKGVPDLDGWLYKQGDKYKTWNKRWFVLKGSNLFYFKRPKSLHVKGMINLRGYKIEVDESIHPGSYCFKAHHERERSFYFYSDSESSMKDWLKAMIKATISRDYTETCIVEATSSSMIATISLEDARKMRPRPPSSIMYCRAK